MLTRGWQDVQILHFFESSVKIDRIDHLVLTVRDVGATCEFYARVLCVEVVMFEGGRRALKFGDQKINLHPADAIIAPHASCPTPGSADLCLVSISPIAAVVAHLQKLGVAIEEGPVPRTGANGPITSVYFRDPDRNLIEVSSYDRDG